MNKQIYDDRNKDGIYFWGGQVCLKRKQKETSGIGKYFICLLEFGIFGVSLTKIIKLSA